MDRHTRKIRDLVGTKAILDNLVGRAIPISISDYLSSYPYESSSLKSKPS
jgi:hypothetical protein